MTPHDKQVMMFSATLAPDIRAVCKKFMTNVRGGSRTLCQQSASAGTLAAAGYAAGLRQQPAHGAHGNPSAVVAAA
eukprot:355265-Chlamydomonas_euryale.AAC.13